MFSDIFDLILPPRKTTRVLRGVTLETLQSIEGEEGLPYHDPRVTSLIWELKYYASRHAASLGGELLAQRLLAIAAEELGKPLLIPIPIHSTRRRERGHNQTEVLCKAALKHVNDSFEYAPHILIRTRETPFQQGLPKHLRLTNVSRSMEAANVQRVAGRVCAVIDDVQTTGATLREAARALKAAGAIRVHTLSLAHS